MKKQMEDERYSKCISHWDSVYSAEGDRAPAEPDTGNAALNDALRWTVESAESALDFGCGNGSLLLFSALTGTRRHVGIDLSSSAIGSAIRRSRRMPFGEYRFLQGGTERLAELPDDAFDAVILSNILDNLYPEDARETLRQCSRVLKPGGRALVKLNPFLTPEQIKNWKIAVIEGDLLDDGLPLWNLTTERWRKILEEPFRIERCEEIDYPEYGQTNRLFLLTKK